MQALPKKDEPATTRFEKNLKKVEKTFKKVLTNGKESGIIVKLPQKRERMILEN